MMMNRTFYFFAITFFAGYAFVFCDVLVSAEFPATPANEWTALLDRSDGWTGADGIFTANLDGTIHEGIEKRPQQRTVFVFSDTILGKVDPKTQKRSQTQMVNHSFAVLQGNEPNPKKIEFFYPKDDKTPKLPITPPEKDHWYWLSECFVLRQPPQTSNLKMYAFLYRIKKTDGGGAFGFRHVGVDLLRIDIATKETTGPELDFNTAKIILDDREQPRLALYRGEGVPATISFGAGVLENLARAGAPEPDEYVYIYGYKDVPRQQRQLVVARVRESDLENFERWEYYAGNDNWSKTLSDSTGIAKNVSTELSVSPLRLQSGQTKYALVYTPGTIGSKIAMRLGETPIGPFAEERILYEEQETKQLGGSVFAYNAKAHPVLSKTGELVISYNLNSNDNTFRIFREADIYRPRFVRISMD